MKRIALIALLLASFALADGVPDEASLFWGGRISLLFGGAWNDKPVKGVFSVSNSKMEESELHQSGSLGLEFGGLCWYRLNRVLGFEGEANLRWTGITLDDSVYNRNTHIFREETYDASLMVWSFDVPLVLRLTPDPDYYLEAGAQFNLNLGGTISDDDVQYEFDFERLGWSLVFGTGFFSYNPQKKLLWSAGFRLVIDMTRIEKDGIVEIWKGVAYREASPLRLWNFQCNLAFYL